MKELRFEGHAICGARDRGNTLVGPSLLQTFPPSNLTPLTTPSKSHAPSKSQFCSASQDKDTQSSKDKVHPDKPNV